MNKATFLVPLALCTAACVDSADEVDDPIDESFIDEDAKTDAFGIKEGTPDALGILELVNTADRTTLKDEAGLTSTAVTKILAQRNGADGTLGTNDDNRFDTLRELDDVPYVGSGSFTRLLAFARDNDYVVAQPPAPAFDPFGPAACGDRITTPRLQHVTGNGLVPLPDAAIYYRSRVCNGALGCGPWSATTRLAEPGKITYSPQSTYVDFAVGSLRTESRPDSHYGTLVVKTEYKYGFRILTPGGNGLTSLNNLSARRIISHTTTGHIQSTWLESATVDMYDKCLRLGGTIVPTAPGQKEEQIVVIGNY